MSSAPAPPAPLARAELRRDLEATVLEAYGQLTLGNVDVYRDGIATDRPITLIGVHPGDVVLGRRPGRVRDDRRLFGELRPAILSKNLDVHLSEDGSVGWVHDEVSYRIPYLGRTASIPVRWTGVYIRDANRWVQVLEHKSVAVPMGEIERLAAARELAAPARMRSRYQSEEGASPLILDLLGRLHNAPHEYREEKLAASEEALLLLPDPGGEFTGEEVLSAPGLASLFGEDGATVGLRDYRIFVSRSGMAAWAATNLVLRGRLAGEPLEIGLRATYVLEQRDRSGWQVVQSHISAGLTKAQVSARVFGPVDIDPILSAD